MTIQIKQRWDAKLAEVARWERTDGLILSHLIAKRDELQAEMDVLNTSISALENLIQERRADLCKSILACMGIVGDTNIHPLITYAHEDVLVYDYGKAKEYALSHAPKYIRTLLDINAFDSALRNADPRLADFDYKIEQKPVIVLGDIDYLADKEGDK